MKNKIIAHIRQNGPISMADYMAMCLYDPQGGYYMKGTPFGKDGDFITAPELTPLFGEMLGLWAAATWQQMGAPEKFNLIEFGPGNGTLYADMLRAISKALPPCISAINGHLVEVSPHLQSKQKAALKKAPCPISWHTTLDTVDFSLPTIAIGNELLDAFPVRQFELHEGAYFERLVTADGDTLKQTLAKTPTDISAHGAELVEQSPTMDAFLANLKTKLETAPTAALLLLDYGSDTENANGDTLQALRHHQYEGIFDTPGMADLTWHIPFTHVCAILGAAKATVTDMALFLTEIGFALRAEQAHRAATAGIEKEHIETTTRRLLDPNQMGRHFKVLGWSNDETLSKQLQGFQHTHASAE